MTLPPHTSIPIQGRFQTQKKSGVEEERYSSHSALSRRSQSCVNLQRGPRRRRCCDLGLGLLGEPARPGRTQQREQVAVSAVVARDTPGQHQEYGQPSDDRVDAHRAR